MKKLNTLKISSAFFVLSASFSAHALSPNKAMGQAIYEQSGANSCVYCHGVGGTGGKVAQAAKLTQPKTWRTYRGLGGDAAYKKNKAEFLKNMDEALIDLIQKGAIAHNAGFKKDYFDWKKAGGTYNAQMLGLGGAPSTAWLNRQKDKGVTKEIAAEAALMFVKTLDKEGVF